MFFRLSTSRRTFKVIHTRDENETIASTGMICAFKITHIRDENDRIIGQEIVQALIKVTHN